MILPRLTSRAIQIASLAIALLSLVVLFGCIPSSLRQDTRQALEPPSNPQFSARLTGFLTLKDSQGPAVRLDLASLEILVDGVWLPLTQGPIIIDSEKIASGQLFLGGMVIPPGHYQRLRMTVARGELLNADGGYTEIIAEPLQLELPLATGLDLETGDSRSLLLSWDVQNSLLPNNSLQLVLTATPPVRQSLLNLIYVSCPDINTIFVVRADNNWVVDSFGLIGHPTYLAIDPDASLQRMYVLTSRDKMVKVVDLSSFRVVGFFPIPMNDQPTFMTTAPDGRNGRVAYLLDERSGYLSRMDLSTGRSTDRVLLGYQPKFALYLSEQNLLAVSLSLSQKVLLLDPDDLAVVRVITTGNAPQGMAVLDNQLYVAESGGGTVSISDLNNRKNQSRLTVGFGPRRLIAIDDQIYVSNYKDGSLSVLMQGQLGVIQEVFGLKQPQEMAFDQFYRRLYVADDEARGLAVIDANSSLLLRYLSLGAKPFGLAVIQ